MQPLDDTLASVKSTLLTLIGFWVPTYLPPHNPALFERLQHIVGLYATAGQELADLNKMLDEQAEVTPAPAGLDMMAMTTEWIVFLEEQLRRAREALAWVRLTPEQQAIVLDAAQRQGIAAELKRRAGPKN